METVISGSEMDQLGNANDSFFSFSQFDLDLQQQAQAAIQQQRQQQQQRHDERSVQELWKDFDCYFPLDCQSFVMNESTTMNESTESVVPPATLPGTSTTYAGPNTSISNTMSLNDFATASMTSTQWSPQDLVKQEYPSPGQHTDTSSPLMLADLMPSLSSSIQQKNSTNNIAEIGPTPTGMPVSQPLLPLASNLDINEIIAGINWNSPVLRQTDSNKVPIHRLKPATEIQTSPSSSIDLPGGLGKQKKTAHNAIERRYRNNINDRITELKNAVPALLHAKLKEKGRTAGSSNKRYGSMLDRDEDDIGDDGEEYLDGVAVATKLNKATILHKATEYIHHLKRTNNDRKLENDALQHLLAQLPGGPQVLAHYQVQKLQREQRVQQQLEMERQWMKRDQQNSKKAAAAANKRKRATRRPLSIDDMDDGSLSSDHLRSPPSDHDTPRLTDNRIFMAVFMTIAFFSSSPLTTFAGSEQVGHHNHVSRTTSEQIVIDTPVLNSTDSFNSHQHTNKYDNDSWVLWTNAWSALRLMLFIICLIQLLFPYIKTWSSHSFKIRRVRSANKARRLLRPSQHTDAKPKNLNVNNTNNSKAAEIPSISPGDEKCIRMTQLLVRSLSVDHKDPSATLSLNTLGFLLSLAKELALFTARHVFGYTIAASTEDGVDVEEWEHQHNTFTRWRHAFKWVKLNECECLGGNPFLSRLGLLYHSVRMLNLVDALQEDELDDMYHGSDDDDDDDDDIQQQHQQQLTSMRARAYATATIQVMLGIPSAYLANWVANYLWGIALNNANDNDIWASMTPTDEQADSNLMTIPSTNVAWLETLDVIRHQMPIVQSSKSSTDLSLSTYAPTLVPTVMLSNLHLLDRLTSDFQTIIDNMMTFNSMLSDKTQPSSPLSVFADISPHALKENDTARVSDWFACVGATVEALWQGDVVRAEECMLALARHVPRAMTVPLHSLKKKERHCELDAIAKQQVVHMLAGATLVLKHDTDAGIKELAIAERFRQLRTKRALAATNELEAMHVEGRVMALAEFAVILVGLKAWIAAWQLGDDVDTSNDRMTEANTQVRLLSLSLRRMVCRPALTGRLKTQQLIIDRLDKLGRYVELPHYGLDDNNNPIECCDADDDDSNIKLLGVTEQDKLVGHIQRMLAIIQGN